MNTWCCLECGKGVKSLSGLSRHMYRCPIVMGKKINITSNILAETPWYSSQSYGQEQRDGDWINLNEVITQTDHIDDGEWIDIDEDPMSSPKLIHRNQSRLSTTVSMRIDSYEEVTGKKAGQIFDDSDIPSRDGRSQSPKITRTPIKIPPFQEWNRLCSCSVAQNVRREILRSSMEISTLDESTNFLAFPAIMNLWVRYTIYPMVSQMTYRKYPRLR